MSKINTITNFLLYNKRAIMKKSHKFFLLKNYLGELIFLKL